MTWRLKLPGAFGDQDLIFAGHPYDADRAFELLRECYNSNVPLHDVLEEAEQYLQSQGAGSQHVQDQLLRINEKFSGWLS